MMIFKTVVVSVESLDASREVRKAMGLVGAAGRVHVLYAQEDAPPAGLQANFEGLKAQVALDAKQVSVALHVRRGDRAEETLRLAAEAGADLIVAGAYNPNSSTVVERLSSWAACSLLILAPNREAAEFEGFLPHFSLCAGCAETRKGNSGHWYCELHQDADRHQFQELR